MADLQDIFQAVLLMSLPMTIGLFFVVAFALLARNQHHHRRLRPVLIVPEVAPPGYGTFDDSASGYAANDEHSLWRGTLRVTMAVQAPGPQLWAVDDGGESSGTLCGRHEPMTEREEDGTKSYSTSMDPGSPSSAREAIFHGEQEAEEQGERGRARRRSGGDVSEPQVRVSEDGEDKNGD